MKFKNKIYELNTQQKIDSKNKNKSIVKINEAS